MVDLNVSHVLVLDLHDHSILNDQFVVRNQDTSAYHVENTLVLVEERMDWANVTYKVPGEFEPIR